MIEVIEEMPPGTIGFRAYGKVTRADYRDVLEPALHEAAAKGEIRLLYLVDSPFEMEAGALFEDAKVGADLSLRHRPALRRTAIVSDVEWVQQAVRLFTWLTPGEVRVWDVDELAEARTWVADRS